MGRVLEHTGGRYDYTNAKEFEDWYTKTTGCVLDNRKYTYIIGRDTRRQIRSAVIYSDYTKYSITMDIYAPKALTRGLIEEMWDYPFNQLKVKKVFGFIDDKNTLSIKTFEKMGCRLEGRFIDFFGEHHDRLVYVATKEDVKKWVTS